MCVLVIVNAVPFYMLCYNKMFCGSFQHFIVCKEMLLKMDDERLFLWALVVFISSMSLQV